MKPYEGDVLEHALNFGVASSAKRFNINKDEVYKLASDFRSEMKFRSCSCESSAAVMCWLGECENSVQGDANMARKRGCQV